MGTRLTRQENGALAFRLPNVTSGEQSEEVCADLANHTWPPLQTTILSGGSSHSNDPPWTDYSGSGRF